MELYASRKRSVVVQKRRTSISLEDSFWHSLHAIARMENTTIGEFVATIARQRVTPNLSSSLRVAVLEYYQQLALHGARARRSIPAPRPLGINDRADGGQGKPSEESLALQRT